MKNIPSSSNENSSNRLGKSARRIALATLLGLAACQPQQAEDQNNSIEVSQKTGINNEKAIELAKQAVKEYDKRGYQKMGLAPREIVKGDVFRLGDKDWDLAFARATLNTSKEYPAALSAQPEEVTVVYLTLSSGSGIVLALDSKTGAFISMDGDN